MAGRERGSKQSNVRCTNNEGPRPRITRLSGAQRESTNSAITSFVNPGFKVGRLTRYSQAVKDDVTMVDLKFLLEQLIDNQEALEQKLDKFTRANGLDQRM